MLCRMRPIPLIFCLLSLTVAVIIVIITPTLKSAASPMLYPFRWIDSHNVYLHRFNNYPAQTLLRYRHGFGPKMQMLPAGMFREDDRGWGDVSDDIQTVNWTDFHESDGNTTVKVIILARMRTGSSFLGQLFNQHPDFFYLFEPFLVLNRMVQNSVLPKQHFTSETIKLLGKLLHCDTSESFVQYLKNEKWMGVHQSKSLPENFNRTQFTKQCKERPHFALKTIRIENIRDLWPYLKNKSENVKIIQLVRDPRGMVHSRIKLKYVNAKRVYGVSRRIMDSQLVHITKDVCQWMVRNAEEAAKGPPWLRQKYKLVRYEDVATNPYKMAKEIYDFLGVRGHLKISEWLDHNTRADPAMKDQSKYLFQTKRNSRATSQAWRHYLTPNTVRGIESLCGKQAFTMFGYKTLVEPTSLANKSFSFVDDRLPIAESITQDDHL
ncbi:carbohydrate sulfotransferase 1-like [Ptychodera flava]|uniref:carbohydrate sulfotransferase 1-like n=1 Tax=Ptychodera flava TaxID=63121 RepID=UPI00396AA810